jgi:hypothetical protein
VNAVTVFSVWVACEVLIGSPRPGNPIRGQIFDKSSRNPRVWLIFEGFSQQPCLSLGFSNLILLVPFPARDAQPPTIVIPNPTLLTLQGRDVVVDIADVRSCVASNNWDGILEWLV